jgi:hypothetical protein
MSSIAEDLVQVVALGAAAADDLATREEPRPRAVRTPPRPSRSASRAPCAADRAPRCADRCDATIRRKGDARGRAAREGAFGRAFRSPRGRASRRRRPRSAARASAARSPAPSPSRLARVVAESRRSASAALSPCPVRAAASTRSGSAQVDSSSSSGSSVACSVAANASSCCPRSLWSSALHHGVMVSSIPSPRRATSSMAASISVEASGSPPRVAATMRPP